MNLAEKMQEPLRAITITFAPGDQKDVIGVLRSSAYNAGFASRVSPDSQTTGNSFLQFYRRDIKLIGHLAASTGEIDLVLYRNGNLLVPAQMIDPVVEYLRVKFAGIASTQFKQVVFTSGDTVTPTSSPGVEKDLGVNIYFPKTQLIPFTDALTNFAKSQQMAIRFERVGQDPTDFTVDLYREEFMISGSGVFTPGQILFYIYKTGDRSVSDGTIDATVAALKQAVETIPGVTFTLQK